MGILFDREQANVVGYLTTSNRRPPRLLCGDLGRLLEALSDGQEQPPERLISGFPQWIDEVRRAANAAREDLVGLRLDWSQQLPEREIAKLLAELRALFSGYRLFGLAVGNWQDDQQLRAFTNYAAIDSGHEALFLITVDWGGHAAYAFDLLDPFPAVALALKRSSEWPGIYSGRKLARQHSRL